jgi:PAS domain S-box-containing protein
VHPFGDQLRAVLDAMPTLVWLAAPDGAAVHISQRWLEYTGLSAEQAGAWGWTAAVHQDDINRLTTHWQTLLASGARGEIEARLRRSDGRYRWFLFSAAPVHDDSGRLTGWCATNIDIDDRHRSEEAARKDRERAEDVLRSSERQLRAIIDNIPALIAIHSLSGDLEHSSRAALEYRGDDMAEMKQSPFRNVHPDDLPALQRGGRRLSMVPDAIRPGE